MKEATYKIDGGEYVQRPLVLGQIEQLTEVLMGVRYIPDSGAAGMVEGKTAVVDSLRVFGSGG